ncbi:MAG TPA: hypothetical protein VF411_00300 [Bacteroidia bacterium]
MKVSCADSKNFELFDNTEKLGSLAYKNWFSYTAELAIGDKEQYEIKPTGLLGATFAVTKADEQVASFKMNWKGQMTLTLKGGQEYVFKRKSMLNSKYIIENEKEQEIIQFIPCFDWTKFKYSYDIFYNDKAKNILLVLLGVYCANYYIAISGGAVTASA